MNYNLSQVQKLIKHFAGYELSEDEITDVLNRPGVNESKVITGGTLTEDHKRLLGRKVVR